MTVENIEDRVGKQIKNTTKIFQNTVSMLKKKNSHGEDQHCSICSMMKDNCVSQTT